MNSPLTPKLCCTQGCCGNPWPSSLGYALQRFSVLQLHCARRTHMRTMWPLRWPNLSSLLIMSTFALSAAKSSVGLSCKPTTNPASFMVSGGRIRNPRQCRGSRRRYFINYDHDSHTRSVRPTLACSLDDLRGVQREKGGLVGDVSYDDGENYYLPSPCISY